MQLAGLSLDRVTPSQIWGKLDPETRQLAAEAIVSDPDTRPEADVAIAMAMRFREVAVRRLSNDQRVDYLLRRVFPDDGLATSLLLALHLKHRRPILSRFLDELKVPHDAGLIDADHDLQPQDSEALAAAIAALDGEFPQPHVDLYLACLLALDPETWAPLTTLLPPRLAG